MQRLQDAAAVSHALADATRQVEALRLLYNEELARASRLAVDLTKVQTTADKAKAEEDGLVSQLKKSDSRADHAEGLAGALKVQVMQLMEELQAEKATLGNTKSK